MYKSLNDYAREKFGCKLYKLSLDGSFTCPNRDGTRGTGGCIFCTGSGEFAEKTDGDDILLQLENAKKRVEKKNKDGKYIAYFQAHTGTYDSVERLEKLFTAAIKPDFIAVLDIATRPDCLGDDVLALLERLNKIKPIWVELGLQTKSDETAKKINRCFSADEYISAVDRLHKIGIEVITHIIFGLPDETEKMMLDSVNFAVDSGTDGIKIHSLYVAKDTELEKMYNAGKYRCLEKDEYIGLLKKAIEIIPKNVVVHRLTGDGDKRTLIAPLWTADKKRVLTDIRKALGE